MRTIGIYLIYGAVAIRGLIDLEGQPVEGLVAVWLAVYGALLVAERWLALRRSSSSGPEQALRITSRQAWFPIIYLLIQIGVVMRLLVIPPYQDTFLALFIPLGLQAVLFFGRRIGFLWIAAFPLAMIPWLVEEPEPGNFVMAAVFEGLCFLVGSYADLIRKAEAVRRENQRVAAELQSTHSQLQEYALQVEELATERERYRLARELHDSVTQTVFSMNLTAQSARLLNEKDASRVAAQLQRLQELASSAMSEIQMLVAQLQSRPATEEGLTAALNRLIAERRRLDGLQVHLECSGEKELPVSVAAGLYSIVQEALTNVVKHAGTRQATVRVNLAAEPSFVEIEDQGAGFEPKSALGQPGHLGLTEMAERASEIGWRLSIDSKPGHGSRIRLEG